MASFKDGLREFGKIEHQKLNARKKFHYQPMVQFSGEAVPIVESFAKESVVMNREEVCALGKELGVITDEDEKVVLSKIAELEDGQKVASNTVIQ